MVRIATYNVEWFTNLFDDHDALVDNNSWSGRLDVTRAEQIEALSRVFRAMDADAVMVIEAPDTNGRRNGVKAIEAFAAHAGIRARKGLIGFPNDTQQEIILLYDPDVLQVRHDPQGDTTGKKGARNAPRFDGVFRIDIDHDAAPDLVKWSKPPLEVSATFRDGRKLRLIGVHAKSKAPHGAQTKSEVMRVSIDNRRKQLAQCIWLRQRIEQHLEADEDLIVLGDFNDGPGLDEYEKLFGRSSIEITMGEDTGIQLFDPHARMALGQRVGASPTTSRFRLPDRGRYLTALLDYVFVSPKVHDTDPIWRIWHPFDDAACYADPVLREALLVASDHFPVSLDMDHTLLPKR